MQHLRSSLLLLSCLSVVVTGCGTLNHMQYQVDPPAAKLGGTRPPLTDADREALKEILRSSAQRLNLEERTEASLVPKTIVYYISPDADNPIKLLAWSQDDHIFVDLMHAPGVPGESSEYQAEKERLWSALQREFAKRATIVPMRKQATPQARR